MGKLMDRLQKQLKNPDTKRDAEDCIKIYNWIKDTDPEGRVWDSRWTPMVSVKWEGTYPYRAIYKPNITGYTLLKGIDKYATDYDKRMNEAIDTVVASYEEESITIELEKKTLLLFAAYMENEMGINIPMSIINNYLENN